MMNSAPGREEIFRKTIDKVFFVIYNKYVIKIKGD